MEMSDYTIRVKNLPNDIEYDGREEILQAHLWSHFSSILGADQTQEAGEEAYHDNHDIVDITFGKQKFEDTEQLMQMNQLLQQNKESRHRLASTVQADSKVKYQDSIEDTETRYQKLKQSYKAR